MRSTLVCLVAITLPALSVLAQRHHGGGGGGFSNNGSGTPNTFITVTSAAPTATSDSSTVASSVAPIPAASSSAVVSSSTSGLVDTSLIPPFGITAGILANDGTPNCVGNGGKDIPCSCPPDSATFASAVETFVAGGLAFPSGTSAADQLTRLQTCIVTLQNFVGGSGSGVGCPAVATTWNALQTQLQSEV